jgi:hypothetical protein
MGPVAMKGEARDGSAPRGPLSVQLRFATGLTSEEYVRQKGWQSATLKRCPLHPEGGCGFARHTPYARVEPPGAQVARFYCPEGHTTFSMLPDCLASRLSSSLEEVERVCTEVEERGQSLEATAQQLRPDIDLQGAMRWVRRRVGAVVGALVALVGLRPDLFAGRQPSLEDFRSVLGVEHVLPVLRETAAGHLAALPPPLGFGPPATRRGPVVHQHQHEAGADPPRGLA